MDWLQKDHGRQHGFHGWCHLHSLLLNELGNVSRRWYHPRSSLGSVSNSRHRICSVSRDLPPTSSPVANLSSDLCPTHLRGMSKPIFVNRLRLPKIVLANARNRIHDFVDQHLLGHWRTFVNWHPDWILGVHNTVGVPCPICTAVDLAHSHYPGYFAQP